MNTFHLEKVKGGLVDEGPFDSLDEAQRFFNSEVGGLICRIVKLEHGVQVVQTAWLIPSNEFPGKQAQVDALACRDEPHIL